MGAGSQRLAGAFCENNSHLLLRVHGRAFAGAFGANGIYEDRIGIDVQFDVDGERARDLADGRSLQTLLSETSSHRLARGDGCLGAFLSLWRTSSYLGFSGDGG